MNDPVPRIAMATCRRLAGVVLLGVSLATRPGPLVAQASDVMDDPDAYAVYTAVLEPRFSSDARPRTRIALLNETRAVTHCPREGTIQPEWQSVVDDYKVQNSRVRILQPGLNLGVPYDLVTVTGLRTLLQEGGYDLANPPPTNGPGARVFARFPGGTLLTVSAVGFNPERTRAMVTLQRNCFPYSSITTSHQICNEGSQRRLEKREGRWELARGVAICTWTA